jgi:hypothetical protein
MEHRPKPEPFDWGKLPGPGPQTESSKERGLESDADESELGQAEGVDPDETGDVADEGRGHRA